MLCFFVLNSHVVPRMKRNERVVRIEFHFQTNPGLPRQPPRQRSPHLLPGTRLPVRVKFTLRRSCARAHRTPMTVKIVLIGTLIQYTY